MVIMNMPKMKMQTNILTEFLFNLNVDASLSMNKIAIIKRDPAHMKTKNIELSTFSWNAKLGINTF